LEPSQPFPSIGAQKTGLSNDKLLTQSGKPALELRSYQFFVEVVGPSLSEGMFYHFWQQDIPRACQQDSAIWHCVVSLSSTFEKYLSRDNRLDTSVLALEQSNTAIKVLIKSFSTDTWWRALIVSTIFTCSSIFDNDFGQAQIHFNYGFKLLREFDTEKSMSKERGPLQTTGQQTYTAACAPVSLSTIRSILIGFEMRNNKLGSAGRISQLPTILSKHDGLYKWKTYVAPSNTKVSGLIISVKNLEEAVRIAELLFYHVSIETLQYTHHLKGIYNKPNNGTFPSMEHLPTPNTQEAILGCIQQLQKATELFKKDFKTRKWPRQIGVTEAEIRKTILSIRLMLETVRLKLSRAPDSLGKETTETYLPTLCTRIVDLSDEIMQLERLCGRKVSGGAVPTASVMNPLFEVATSGYGYETRKRAIRLLRYPRVEGLWDTRLSASLADAILDKEQAASQDYSQPGLVTVLNDRLMSGGWMVADRAGDYIHPLARVVNMVISFGEGKQAKLELRTLYDWINDAPAHEVTITW
jgi:hypothetical protein